MGIENGSSYQSMSAKRGIFQGLSRRNFSKRNDGTSDCVYYVFLKKTGPVSLVFLFPFKLLEEVLPNLVIISFLIFRFNTLGVNTHTPPPPKKDSIALPTFLIFEILVRCSRPIFPPVKGLRICQKEEIKSAVSN